MSTSSASRGACVAGSSLRAARSDSGSASRRSGAATSGPPNLTRPHPRTGCNGVFCNSCDEFHSIHECGLLGQLAAETLQPAGICRCRAHRQSGRTVRRLSKSAFRAASQDCEVLFAADETGEKPSAPSAPVPRRLSARCDKALLAPELLLSSWAPLSSTMNSPATCRWTVEVTSTVPGSGRCLNPRGNVGGLAEHLAVIVDDDVDRFRGRCERQAAERQLRRFGRWPRRAPE